jgi:hypothetical protein
VIASAVPLILNAKKAPLMQRNTRPGAKLSSSRTEINPESVVVAFERIRETAALEKYLWIQNTVHIVDVSTDLEFQRRFNHYYRVGRKKQSWYRSYYETFQHAKNSAEPDFAKLLRAIHRKTGTIEASFTSKLVATLNPNKPVIDSQVLARLGLRLPYHYQADRLCRVISLYFAVESEMLEIINSKGWQLIERMFNQAFPSAQNIASMKKLDLTLWQIDRGLSKTLTSNSDG